MEGIKTNAEVRPLSLGILTELIIIPMEVKK